MQCEIQANLLGGAKLNVGVTPGLESLQRRGYLVNPGLKAGKRVGPSVVAEHGCGNTGLNVGRRDRDARYERRS